MLVQRFLIVLAAAGAPAWAADVQWTLSGPAQVNRGDPVPWTAAVAVAGNNQGLAGYAFTLAVGPQPGPAPGADGQWGTADDQNLIGVPLPPANWVESFRVGGVTLGSVKDLAGDGGPGMSLFPLAGTNSLPGELQQVGAGYLAWSVPGNVAGVGLDSRKAALLADPAGAYVLHSGVIPTANLPAGAYTALLVPLASRVLRADLDFSQPQPGFIMTRATAAGDSFDFTVVVPSIPGDFDGDGDVDAVDLGSLTDCSTGPEIPYSSQSLPPGCAQAVDPQGYIAADLDLDRDVDSDDFGVFQRCFSGASAGDPGCAD